MELTEFEKAMLERIQLKLRSARPSKIQKESFQLDLVTASLKEKRILIKKYIQEMGAVEISNEIVALTEQLAKLQKLREQMLAY